LPTVAQTPKKPEQKKPQPQPQPTCGLIVYYSGNPPKRERCWKPYGHKGECG